MNTLIQRLNTQYPLLEITMAKDNLAYLTIEARQVLDVLHWLKSQEGFGHLVLISAVDWMEESRFQLTYHLHHYGLKRDVGIRTFIDREAAVVQSIHTLWPTASVYQREIREMFGIDFPGSPRVAEPLILEGWDQMPPMRRDFDTLAYSEATFFPRPGRFSVDPATKMEEGYPTQAKVKHGIARQL
jgi:NADH-quinone oxidoreductase subunit C